MKYINNNRQDFIFKFEVGLSREIRSRNYEAKSLYNSDLPHRIKNENDKYLFLKK